MRSVRHTAGAPPTASKNPTIPSKVQWRSSLAVNHHNRRRLQHKIIPKQRNGPPQPQRRACASRLHQSNWASSPGSVQIGTDTRSGALKRAPRIRRNCRVTVE